MTFKLDHSNEVILLGIYGSDLTHAMSAWTSTSRDLDEDKLNRLPKLLKTLAENKHLTPFEKSSLHFLVNGEIASHIHLLKHRVAVSINRAKVLDIKNSKRTNISFHKTGQNKKKINYRNIV